jgi:hypothetical protein
MRNESGGTVRTVSHTHPHTHDYGRTSRRSHRLERDARVEDGALVLQVVLESQLAWLGAACVEPTKLMLMRSSRTACRSSCGFWIAFGSIVRDEGAKEDKASRCCCNSRRTLGASSLNFLFSLHQHWARIPDDAGFAHDRRN